MQLNMPIQALKSYTGYYVYMSKRWTYGKKDKDNNEKAFK